MVYVRAGTVTEQPSIVTRVLDLPMTIYRFFMFFVMTLIDPSAAKKASASANSRSKPARKPLAGMKNIQGGPGGGCGPGMGG